MYMQVISGLAGSLQSSLSVCTFAETSVAWRDHTAESWNQLPQVRHPNQSAFVWLSIMEKTHGFLKHVRKGDIKAVYPWIPQFWWGDLAGVFEWRVMLILISGWISLTFCLVLLLTFANVRFILFALCLGLYLFVGGWLSMHVCCTESNALWPDQSSQDDPVSWVNDRSPMMESPRRNNTTGASAIWFPRQHRIFHSGLVYLYIQCSNITSNYMPLTHRLLYSLQATRTVTRRQTRIDLILLVGYSSISELSIVELIQASGECSDSSWYYIVF